MISHLGYEFYPSWIARWFITSTHHNMHHTNARGHFMLYFNIWDRLMGTNEARYEGEIEKINARVEEARARREDVRTASRCRLTLRQRSSRVGRGTRCSSPTRRRSRCRRAVRR